MSLKAGPAIRSRLCHSHKIEIRLCFLSGHRSGKEIILQPYLIYRSENFKHGFIVVQRDCVITIPGCYNLSVPVRAEIHFFSAPPLREILLQRFIKNPFGCLKIGPLFLGQILLRQHVINESDGTKGSSFLRFLCRSNRLVILLFRDLDGFLQGRFFSFHPLSVLIHIAVPNPLICYQITLFIKIIILSVNAKPSVHRIPSGIIRIPPARIALLPSASGMLCNPNAFRIDPPAIPVLTGCHIP